MKRFILISLVAAVCCGCFTSCNEKPQHYRFVKITTDGKEVVEQMDAKDDTVALNLYLKKMEEILVNSIGKEEESPYKAMFIISRLYSRSSKDHRTSKSSSAAESMSSSAAFLNHSAAARGSRSTAVPSRHMRPMQT